MTHRRLFWMAGTIWFLVGFFLLQLGMRLFAESLNSWPEYSFFLPLFASWMGAAETLIVLISLGLLIGYFKGRYLLGKTARRTIQQILAAAPPPSLRHLFNLRYALLISLMMLLGFSMRYLALPLDVRGFVDVAVGAALIHGALFYFRAASLSTFSSNQE